MSYDELRIKQYNNEKNNSEWLKDNSELHYLTIERTIVSCIKDNIQWYIRNDIIRRIPH